MSTKYLWDNKQMARIAEIFRERAEYQSEILKVSRQAELTNADELRLKELAACIAECDYDIAEIEAETFEQAQADWASHQADERRKEII